VGPGGYVCPVSFSSRPWHWSATVWVPASAVLVLVITLIGTRFAALDQPTARPLDALGVALLAAGPVALVARRRFRRRC
jgi:hypothetical protein